MEAPEYEEGEEEEEEENEVVKMDPITGRRVYSGFQVIRTHPRSDEDINTLRFLEKGRSKNVGAIYSSQTVLHRYVRYFTSAHCHNVSRQRPLYFFCLNLMSHPFRPENVLGLEVNVAKAQSKFTTPVKMLFEY